MDVDAIIAGLSAAQRRTVTMRPERDATVNPVWAYAATLGVLDRLGLIAGFKGYPTWVMLTPLGLAVRSALIERAAK